MSGISVQSARTILRRITINGVELQNLPEEKYVKNASSLRSLTKKTATPITALKTAITPSLSLKILFRRDKIVRIEILKEKERKILYEFIPYFLKEGDPLVDVRSLSFKGIKQKCLEVYLKLKKVTSFGTTVTYGDLASLTNTNPRFVGYCMKINPFPVIVPCHRVVSKNGLGGFSYGLDIKRELLKHEGLFL